MFSHNVPEVVTPIDIGRQLDAAEGYFIDQVHKPEWDELGSLFGADKLPVGDARERLEAISKLSHDHLNLRGMFNGVERRGLDLHLGEWGALLGLPGIDDPESRISTQMMDIHRGLGLTERRTLPAEISPQVVVALGCFGVSVLHRVQVQHGLVPTRLGADGDYRPVALIDETAHPALVSGAPIRVTLSSYRQLMANYNEPKEAMPFAPEALTEFDLAIAASRLALGGKVEEHYEELSNVGYEFVGPAGCVVTQTNNGRTAINICAPLPSAAERGRAQTPHTYNAMGKVLSKMTHTEGELLLPPDSTIALVTNADFGPFQETAALSAMLEHSWRLQMVTFTGDQTNVPQFNEQPQLRLMAEAHSNVRQLKPLGERIARLSLQLAHKRTVIV